MQYQVNQTRNGGLDFPEPDKVVIAIGDELELGPAIEVEPDEAIEFATKVLARALRVKGVAV